MCDARERCFPQALPDTADPSGSTASQNLPGGNSAEGETEARGAHPQVFYRLPRVPKVGIVFWRAGHYEGVMLILSQHTVTPWGMFSAKMSGSGCLCYPCFPLRRPPGTTFNLERSHGIGIWLPRVATSVVSGRSCMQDPQQFPVCV